jgi:hypothetical protein
MPLGHGMVLLILVEYFGERLERLTLACMAKPMTLSWQDTSENEEGFRIYRVINNEKQFVAQVGPNVTQYADADAPLGACYVVTAFNAAGESPATNSACKQP